MKIDIENFQLILVQKKEFFIDLNTEVQKKWIRYYLLLFQNI